MPLEFAHFSYLQLFVICSPPIVAILGWGLYKNHPVARIGMVSYLLLSIIVSMGNYFLTGVLVDVSSITLIILLLGVLILSDNHIISKGRQNQIVMTSEAVDED